MNLYFCPRCRRAFSEPQPCPNCKVMADAKAGSYIEKLLETILSKETNRAGMAVDVWTRLFHEPRASVLLTMLLERTGDPYPLVIGARGLGWLGNAETVPALAKLLLNENQPYVARVAAAEALGRIGGEESIHVLERVQSGLCPSVVEVSNHVLKCH